MTTMLLGSWISRCALWAVFVCATFSLALGQNKSDGCLKDSVCKGHYQEALKQYDAGQYDSALVGFQAAYARRQMPWLLINIGRTVQRLGRPQEAINYYERYKKAEPNIDAEALARINKFIDQAKALLESTPEQPNLPVTPPPKVEPPSNPPPTSSLTTTPGPAPGSGVDAAASKPVYKKWWFWTIIGVVVAGGAVTAGVLGSGVANPKKPDPFLPTDTIYTPTF